MPMPKSVKLAGIPYKVNSIKGLNHQKAKIDSETPESRLWGSCSSGHQEINVEEDISIDTKKMTFLHECIHMMLNHTTYAQSEEQENICMALEFFLYAFIRDNPKAIAYIQEKK